MKNSSAKTCIHGIVGHCGGQKVFMGFATSRILYAHSFPDVLNEDTGKGYQRPRNIEHSRDFRRYIQHGGASTIPLAFNLRKEMNDCWDVKMGDFPHATLFIKGKSKCLAQVDCQHRIGELGEDDVPLAFMSFIGLEVHDEMALFNIINSKAKGLCTSLTDYHESNLLQNLATDAPHLYLARRINEDRNSPWFMMIRYGGETSSGHKRRTSLRMMQKSIQKLLASSTVLKKMPIEDQYGIIMAYWNAVRTVFPKAWEDHRHHLLTKGVGLYSLTLLLGEILRTSEPGKLNEDFFARFLRPLTNSIDWSSNGTFSDVGGQKGANEAFRHLKRSLEL